MPFKTPELKYLAVGKNLPLPLLNYIRKLGLEGLSVGEIVTKVQQKFPGITAPGRIESSFQKLKNDNIIHKSGAVIKKFSSEELKKAGADKITVEDYKKLRNKPENRILSKPEFVKVLEEGKYKTPHNKKFNTGNIGWFDKKIDFKALLTTERPDFKADLDKLKKLIEGKYKKIGVASTDLVITEVFGDGSKYGVPTKSILDKKVPGVTRRKYNDALRVALAEARKLLKANNIVNFEQASAKEMTDKIRVISDYSKKIAQQGPTRGIVPELARTHGMSIFNIESLIKKAGVFVPIAKIHTSAAEGRRAISEARADKLRKLGTLKFERRLTGDKTFFLPFFKESTLIKSGPTVYGPLDLGHRASYDQFKKLGQQYSISTLGTDIHEINRKALKAIETDLKPFYETQLKLYNQAKKLDTIPKNLQLAIDANNKDIAEYIAKNVNTKPDLKGRILGVQVDPYNLKAGTTPIDYSKSADFGVFDKPASQLSPEEFRQARAIYQQNVKSEGVATNVFKTQSQIQMLYKNASRPQKSLIQVILGCRKAAESGGRIGFADGTLDACVNTKLKNQTLESGQKIVAGIEEGATGVLGKMRNVAQGFLGTLGKWGPRIGKYGAIAAAGAVAQPLVKQFRNDDPSTWLTDPDQQAGMLTALIEGERPKPRSEILDWGIGAGTVGATAAAVPGTSALWKARRLPTLKRAGMGMPRAALGPAMKLISGMYTPAGILATEPLRIAQKRREGESWGDIATDPVAWMGPAFAPEMTRMATRGMKRTPGLARALSLGMSPGALKTISRRFGMPGLALSLGLSGYETYQDYKKGRGFFASEE